MAEVTVGAHVCSWALLGRRAMGMRADFAPMSRWQTTAHKLKVPMRYIVGLDPGCDHILCHAPARKNPTWRFAHVAQASTYIDQPCFNMRVSVLAHTLSATIEIVIGSVLHCQASC